MSLSFSGAVFYVFAAILVFAALRVITIKNPVHAALFLVLAFFSAAAIWMLMRAEFLAIALALVYVGAVMVLFLFVVMMLDINVDALRAGFKKAIPVSMLVGVLILFEMVLVLLNATRKPMGSAAMPLDTNANTKALGNLLYTHYVYAFELAAVVLLVAIIAAIALTHRSRRDSKYQDPGQQVKVQRNDRVRLLKMDAVKMQPVAAPLAAATPATAVPTAAAPTEKKVGA